MKLIKPDIALNPADPFSQDLFNRRSYGESLKNLINRVNDSIVMMLEANWGEGKSTFLHMWQAQLRLENIKSLYFDAFQNDYGNDPFIDLVSEVCEFIDGEFADTDSIIESNSTIKDSAAVVSKRLFGWAARVAAEAATVGALKEVGAKSLEEGGKSVARDAEDMVSEMVLEKIKMHAAEKNAIIRFKEELEHLGELIKGVQGFPLVIIIDELDRCRPIYAVEVIERIKRFFASRNVVFVLAANSLHMQESIKMIYGNIDALSYMKKFVNIESRLPKGYGYSSVKDYKTYSSHLFDVHEFEAWVDKAYLVNVSASLGEYLNLSLRELDKVYTNLAIHYASVKSKALNLVPVIVALAVCKVISPSTFVKLKNNKISFDEFDDEFSLDGVSEYEYTTNYPSTFSDCFKVCLYSDAELCEEPPESKIRTLEVILREHDIKRRNVIPWYCASMEVFDFVQT